MEILRDRYALVLVHIDKFGLDLAGNDFSNKDFIEAEKYEKNKDISNGIYGTLWGYTCDFPYIDIKNDNGSWVIVKTEYNNNFIIIDSMLKTVKFENGIVIHRGNLQSCGNRLWDEKSKKEYKNNIVLKCSKKENFAGTDEWFKKWKEYKRNMIKV